MYFTAWQRELNENINAKLFGEWLLLFIIIIIIVVVDF
jgi:hypothetical protein